MTHSRSRNKILRCALLVIAVLLVCAFASTAADRGFTFVQLADTQIGFSSGDLVADTVNFRRAVEQINLMRPAFVLISGDLVNKAHDPKQIRAFWRIAREIDPAIPLHLVPGNHDLAATEGSIGSYRKLFGDDRYAFSYAGCEFIVLNSCVIHDADADPKLRDEQRDWLVGALEKARERKSSHIFVCAHHPWFINDPDEKDEYFNIPGAQRQDYLELFERFDARWLLAGHLHRNSVVSAGKLDMIATSAVSKPLGSDPVGFRVFRVYPDRVEHEYRPLDWP